MAGVPSDQPNSSAVDAHGVQDQLRRLSGVGPVAMLVILMLIVGGLQPSFLTIGSFRALTTDAALFVLLAAGETLVIMIGGIDLSIGALASLATVLLALWFPTYGLVAVLMVLLLAGALGAIQGYVHAVMQVPSFIVTLGAMGIWDSMALMASNASTISVAQGLGPLSWLNGSSLGVPNDFILGLVVVGFGWAMMRWLPIGRSVLAIGNAERAAVVAGVSATQVRVFVFAASGVSAGLAALVLVAQQQSGAPTMADPLFLPTIAAVVVGGTAITGGSGGLAHTVVGAMIITVLRVGMSIMGISPLYQQIVYGVFLIFAIAVTVDRSKSAMLK